MIYKNGIDLFQGLREFIGQSSHLAIFVPYIKLNSLEQLLKGHPSCTTIVVRWEPRDLLLGASDVEVYAFCKINGIKLFRNPRLHLKAFVDNYKRCFFGSANISARALNNPESDIHNYELCTMVDNLSFGDRLYLNAILNESTLITDSIYRQIIEQLPEKKKEFPKESEFKIEFKSPDKNFLISSLPMSSSVKTLSRIYLEGKGIHEEELNCALHDLALYGIPLGLSESEFLLKLKDSFLSHPFIRTFILMVQVNEGQVFFGQAKAWIHDNCSDVPTPRRWEITENLQILYRWLVELGDGFFAVDRPNHSERLHIV